MLDIRYHPAKASLLDAYQSVTRPDEHELARAFRRKEDAVAFLAGRAITRLVLARRLGVPPVDIAISRACQRCGHPTHGRPRVLGLQRPPEFSLTRTGSVVAVCIAPSLVGLDAERMQTNIAELIGADVFGAEDRAWIAEGDADQRLLSRWVTKEAVGKASEQGLIDGALIRIRSYSGEWCEAEDSLGRRYHVAHVSIPGAAAAAVAVPWGCQALPIAVRALPPGWLPASLSFRVSDRVKSKSAGQA